MSLPNQRPVRTQLLRVLLVTAAILLVPAIAMQFTGEVDWGLDDFAAAAGLLLATGGAYVLSARLANKHVQHVLVGCLLAVVLVFAWAELAVGIFDV